MTYKHHINYCCLTHVETYKNRNNEYNIAMNIKLPKIKITKTKIILLLLLIIIIFIMLDWETTLGRIFVLPLVGFLTLLLLLCIFAIFTPFIWAYRHLWIENSLIRRSWEEITKESIEIEKMLIDEGKIIDGDVIDTSDEIFPKYGIKPKHPFITTIKLFFRDARTWGLILITIAVSYFIIWEVGITDFITDFIGMWKFVFTGIDDSAS